MYYSKSKYLFQSFAKSSLFSIHSRLSFQNKSKHTKNKMKVLKIRKGEENFVKYERENFGKSKMFRQFLRHEDYIDARVASKYEPQLILKGHRIILAATSKFLHQKFKKNPDPNATILIEAVEHKHLNYFMQMIYEGVVILPQNDVDCFKATLRVLNVKLDEDFQKFLNSDDEDEDICNFEEPGTISSTKSNESLVNSDANSQDDETKSQNDEIDVKPDVKPQMGSKKTSPSEFLNRVSHGNRNFLIREFPDQSQIESPVAKRPKVIEPPPIFRRSKPQKGNLGLFWIENSNPEKKSVDHFKQICSTTPNKSFAKDGKIYFGFETEKEASDFMENLALVTNSTPKAVTQVPLVSQNYKIIQVENINPSWNEQGFRRLLKKNKISIVIQDLDFDQKSSKAKLKVEDNFQMIERIVKVLKTSNMSVQVL